VAGEEQELPYQVEMWDDHDAHVEELIALVADHAVAHTAFAEAVKRRPGKIITLRQKSRVLADSRGQFAVLCLARVRQKQLRAAGCLEPEAGLQLQPRDDAA
jgi:hypothetical protein